MTRTRLMLVVGLGAAAAAVWMAVARHLGPARGRRVAGGLLIANAKAYDSLTHRLLLGSP
jgi:hypothetical protein